MLALAFTVLTAHYPALFIGGFLFLTVFNDFFERLLNRDLDGDGTIGRSMRGGYRLNWDVVPRIGQGRINIH